MTNKGLVFFAGLSLVLFQSLAHGMGLRSFVALPVEQGGTVLRSTIERNADTDNATLVFNAAVGISSWQTLLLGLPYRLSPSGSERLGDIGALYRQIIVQSDTTAGTDRLGVLAGVVIPTAGERDEALQVGMVFTHYRGRHEIDLDGLYQRDLGGQASTARYDMSWQYRISPREYPDWGIPNEWYVVTELGGRWKQDNTAIHQMTFGLQRVAKRWVVEGGVIQDVNSPHETRYLFSIRFH
ncbi:MAG: hypothetical protein V3T17_19910 [Pseudomonadales bacterium]